MLTLVSGKKRGESYLGMLDIANKFFWDTIGDSERIVRRHIREEKDTDFAGVKRKKTKFNVLGH
jgi:hypothetical protein